MSVSERHAKPVDAKPLGFWSCWSLTVGCVIGSGIFLVPSALAPYGLISFGGWIIAGGGAIALALVFGRLASRTSRNGGPYVYAQEAFGDLPGFLVAWGYWVSYVIAIPIVALAFVGYLGVFAPAIAASTTAQAASGLALIAIFTLINVRGLKEMSVVQIAMTALKIVPLAAIAGLALFAGSPANLPVVNMTGLAPLSALAATALITLWPFTGFEVTTLPAGSVTHCKRTIPRALTFGMLAVTAIYLSATTAVMLLVPQATLAQSTAPFADAARGFGPWGPYLVAAGAMIATAGTLNAVVFTCGQMPMAVALDQLAPPLFARLNGAGAPHLSLLISSAIGAALLLANFSRGLLGAFTFLVMMSTALALFYYFFSALAELRHSWRDARAWAVVALLGCAYSVFAIVGSGWEVLGWGVLLMLCGAPLFYFGRRRPAAVTRPS